MGLAPRKTSKSDGPTPEVCTRTRHCPSSISGVGYSSTAAVRGPLITTASIPLEAQPVEIKVFGRLIEALTCFVLELVALFIDEGVGSLFELGTLLGR